jgi:hypothetical protein
MTVNITLLVEFNLLSETKVNKEDVLCDAWELLKLTLLVLGHCSKNVIWFDILMNVPN